MKIEKITENLEELLIVLQNKFDDKVYFQGNLYLVVVQR